MEDPKPKYKDWTSHDFVRVHMAKYEIKAIDSLIKICQELEEIKYVDLPPHQAAGLRMYRRYSKVNRYYLVKKEYDFRAQLWNREQIKKWNESH